MNSGLSCDEDLLRRLPLPLAQLYRRAHNAKSALESHLAAFYLWEAGLKLLATGALVEHSLAAQPAAQLTDDQGRDLQSLARPSLGHWWKFIKILLPRLADGGDQRFIAVRDLLLGRARDDLPRAAGLDAALRELLSGQGSSRATVKLADLFDRLVQLRNEELGHGAVGARSRGFYERTGPALLAGVAEVFARLDVRAGRRLVYVGDVHRQGAGGWLVERYELIGESPRRLESLEIPESATAQLPRPGRVYLEAPRPAAPGPEREQIAAVAPDHGQTPLARRAPTTKDGEWSAFHCLHPLIAYDADANEVRFFNEFDRKSKRLAYLCYTTSATTKQPDLDDDYLRLLAGVLGQPVGTEQVERWADQAVADNPASAAEADSSLRHIGEFELHSKLGWGGMGVVYRARQPSLGREVALKLMRQIGNPRAESRFAREIRALGHVEHPNLVKVFTSGADGERWFYTMELVEGTTLEAVQAKLTSGGSRAGELDLTKWKETLSIACAETRKAEEPVSSGSSNHTPAISADQRPSPQGAPATAGSTAALAPTDRSYLRQMAELIREVADADHALHEAGVVHRDIKPGNIMVTDDGNRAVLMDLGLAQLTDEVEGRLTRTREFLGTPRYASPEQVLAAGRVDRRSDIYSLGATLWELLTLRPMYGATDETPFAEVARRIQIREPERVRKYNSRVPRDLDAIVLKCLEKDPDRRYATARELAADLQHFLRGQPVAARPVGNTERTWRWCRRNPLVSSLLAAVVMAVVAGLVGVIWKWRDAESNLARALAAEQRANESRYAADMYLAQEAAETGNFGRAISLLQRYRPTAATQDLPGFEWRHLCWLCQGDSIATFHNPADQELGVAFSPDGRILATSSADGTVLLHDPAQLDRPPVHLPSLGQSVQALEFSRDGQYLACGTGNWRSVVDDCQVRLWSVAEQKFVATLEDPGRLKTVNAIAFSSDGKLLAVASEDHEVRVWRMDSPSGELIAHLPGYSRGANDISFAAGTHRLAIGWGDGLLEVWDLDANKKLVNQLVHISGIITLSFAPDGQTIVIASRDGPLFYYDMKASRLSEPTESGQGIVESVRFSGDGSQFVTGGTNCTVVLWDAASRRPLGKFSGHRDVVFNVAFAPQGHTFATASMDRTVKLWDPSHHLPVPTLPHQGIVESLAFSADGKLLVTADGRAAASGAQQQGKVYLWNMQQLPLQAIALGAHDGSIGAVAISPDGRLVASGSTDHTAKIWDVVSRKAIAVLGEPTPVTAVRFAPTRSTNVLATGNEGGAVKLWSPAADGQWTAALLGNHKGVVTSLAFSPDGKLLASSSGDGTVRLWDVAAQSLLSALEGHQGQCYTCEFSPDGALLASGSHDRTVRIWDVKNRKFHKEDATVLPGYNASIDCLAFSPDGKTLAGGNRDSTITLWSVVSLKELAVFSAHRGGVMCCAFSPDGAVLATGGTDETVKLWQTIKSTDGSELFDEKAGWSQP